MSRLDARILEGEGRHLADRRDLAQPRVMISRCLLGDAVRYDGRDKRLGLLDDLRPGWSVVPVCPELEAGLGVPRPPMDLVGPPGAATPMERASGRDLGPVMAPVCARHRARWAAEGLDGAVLKRRSPSCGTGTAARYDRRTDPEPAERVDGVFAAALRTLDPPPALIDEVELAEVGARAAFVFAVEMRHLLRTVGPGAVGPALAEQVVFLRRQTADEIDFGDIGASVDRTRVVEHIDRVATALATVRRGDHQTNGSGLAERCAD